jgi:hypothetical protein
MEKFIPSSFISFFNTDLPFPKPDSLARKWGNKQFCQHQMLFAAKQVVDRMLFRADLFLPDSKDLAIEELRENLRKLFLMLEYAVENDDRWQEENIDYSELCAYIDIQLLKTYPDEQHTTETLPA